MGTENPVDFMHYYRLKSARRKKRSQKEDFDKQLIALDKKRSELWKKRRGLGYEPLIPPIQKGWKRFFILREDVARSSSAEFYQRILQQINTVQHSNRKDFKVKKKRLRRRVYEAKTQNLREFYAHEWKSSKLKLTEAEKAHFIEVIRYSKNHKYGSSVFTAYVFNEPWRFVLCIRPHMITEKRIIDADLEREIAHVDNYIEQNALRGKIHRLTNGRQYSYRRWDGRDKPQYANPLKNKVLHTILAEFYQ